MAPTAAVEPVFPACSAPSSKKRGEFASREPGGRAGMGVWRPGAFMDLDEGPCGLWSRLARYGACNCRSGVPPPDSAAGMVQPYWAARCAAGEFAGGHEPPGDRPARRRGGGCGAHLMPRHIHGHPADPPYRLSYSRAPSRTPSGIGLLALHSQWHSRLAERIFSVLSRQRSPWPPAKPARGGSNDGRNRWQRKDHLRNRNVAK